MRRCLALPFTILTELQEVVDDLRTCEMDSKAAEEAKVEFMDYIQSTWIDNLARKCGVVLAGRATTQTIARRHIMRSSTGHCLFVFDRLILLDVSFYQLVNNCSHQVGRCGTSQPPQSYPCDRGGTQHG